MRRFRRALLSPYHYLWALGSACYYGFPARKLTVIGVTGTKGKSSVTEMLGTVLERAAVPTAVAGTIRFAIRAESRPNLYKMTLPGRGFIQKFLADAVAKGCTHAVVELTSEGALQHRHRFLALDALIFTNLQREHIESHGSFEKYADAKFRIGRALAASLKRPRAIIANADDAASERYLALPVEERLPFAYADAHDVELGAGTAAFTYRSTRFTLRLPGSFSVMNALAVIRTAEFLRLPLPSVRDALAALTRIPGRTERIEVGQDFTVVVDYAHTPDSLQALYDAYPVRKLCVLGNTGGGRDTWKRPAMGRIADASCAEVFLTNEDPYDENPRAIVDAMATGMARTPTIIMDRREAIRAGP
jgi:UDP-N-acetylmuramoyl-L-alanyl-D-glutamate--2,6-diaminopimelate ligase